MFFLCVCIRVCVCVCVCVCVYVHMFGVIVNIIKSNKVPGHV